MAISKAYLAPNGVSGNYWVTRTVYQSPDNSFSRVVLDMYASQAAFVSGAPALLDVEYVMGADGSNAFVAAKLANVAETKIIGLAGILNGGSVVS